MLLTQQMPNVMEIKVERQQDDYFLQKRVELMIDVANRKVLAEVMRLREEMQRLQQEVTSLRKHSVSSASIQVSQPSSMAAPMQAAQAQTDVRRGDFSPERKVSADMPRYGHYTSQDVSIEKFFNFGSGRRK